MTDDWLPVDRWPEPLVLRYGNDEALKRRGLDRFVAASLREPDGEAMTCPRCCKEPCLRGRGTWCAQ